MTQDTDAFSDTEILARTIYGEARNQPAIGQRAIAAVIMNRARHAGWWGSAIRDVCLKPFQFSCWNAHDPNRAVILSVQNTDPVFARCLAIAELAQTDVLSDPTGGADSYAVRGLKTAWNKNLAPIAEIGDHDFYQTV